LIECATTAAAGGMAAIYWVAAELGDSDAAVNQL
jgi:hypothetical protein